MLRSPQWEIPVTRGLSEAEAATAIKSNLVGPCVPRGTNAEQLLPEELVFAYMAVELQSFVGDAGYWKLLTIVPITDLVIPLLQANASVPRLINLAVLGKINEPFRNVLLLSLCSMTPFILPTNQVGPFWMTWIPWLIMPPNHMTHLPNLSDASS